LADSLNYHQLDDPRCRNFKARLQKESNKEIEQLKSALQISASEHQIRFEKLYERRAFVIAELYSLLVDMHDTGARFVFQHNDANLEVADEKRRALYTFYAKQRIYIPEHICGLLDQMVDEISKQTITVDVYREGYCPTPRSAEDRRNAMVNAVKAYEQEIPRLKKAIDAEFRKLLGETPFHSDIPKIATG
jgi:hypothetical protein